MEYAENKRPYEYYGCQGLLYLCRNIQIFLKPPNYNKGGAIKELKKFDMSNELNAYQEYERITGGIFHDDVSKRIQEERKRKKNKISTATKPSEELPLKKSRRNTEKKMCDACGKEFNRHSINVRVGELDGLKHWICLACEEESDYELINCQGCGSSINDGEHCRMCAEDDGESWNFRDDPDIVESKEEEVVKGIAFRPNHEGQGCIVWPFGDDNQRKQRMSPVLNTISTCKGQKASQFKFRLDNNEDVVYSCKSTDLPAYVHTLAENDDFRIFCIGAKAGLSMRLLNNSRARGVEAAFVFDRVREKAYLVNFNDTQIQRHEPLNLNQLYELEDYDMIDMAGNVFYYVKNYQW